MRELFNLMNFLDPANWNDLPALEREYADLDEDLVKQLHNLLRPYFLRRIKSEVLDLPPKVSISFPFSSHNSLIIFCRMRLLYHSQCLLFRRKSIAQFLVCTFFLNLDIY